MSKEYKIELIISLLLNLLIIPYLMRCLQHSQTMTFVARRPLIKCSYKEFKKRFLVVNWILNDSFQGSLFTDRHYDSRFHAAVIEINNDGYILTTIGNLMAIILKIKTINELKKQRPITRYVYV